MRMAATLTMLMLTASFAIGCSSFEQRWESATAAAPPEQDITGPWVGTWHSDHNDHTGDLRALVTANDDGSYDVHYHATYGNVLTLTYEYDLHGMQVEPDEDAGVYRFAGESDLGWWGSYSHDGHATPTEFVADYEASLGDYGTYRMTRPEPETP